jgi:hypothetical protein
MVRVTCFIGWPEDANACIVDENMELARISCCGGKAAESCSLPGAHTFQGRPVLQDAALVDDPHLSYQWHVHPCGA